MSHGKTFVISECKECAFRKQTKVSDKTRARTPVDLFETYFTERRLETEQQGDSVEPRGQVWRRQKQLSVSSQNPVYFIDDRISVDEMLDYFVEHDYIENGIGKRQLNPSALAINGDKPRRWVSFKAATEMSMQTT